MGADWGCREQVTGFTGGFYWFDHYWCLENPTDGKKSLKRYHKNMCERDRDKRLCVFLIKYRIKVTKSNRNKQTNTNTRQQAPAQTNTSFSCLSTPLIPALNCRDPEWQTVAPLSNPNQKIYLIHTPTNPHLHTHSLTSHPYPALVLLSSCISTLFLFIWCVQ